MRVKLTIYDRDKQELDRKICETHELTVDDIDLIRLSDTAARALLGVIDENGFGEYLILSSQDGNVSVCNYSRTNFDVIH